MFSINSLLRQNIKDLKPYSSARDEYSGVEATFLDANENPFESGFNRYPDPYQRLVKEKITKIKSVPPENTFLGNGSDEAIDLLFRAFCEPGIDNVLSMKPSYGMYQVCADINNVEFRQVLLNSEFQLDTKALLAQVDSRTKLIFLCSPNNPTANSINPEDILTILNNFSGLVIVDEAYIDFSSQPSFLGSLKEFPNLVVLQTFSKAWGMAGIRLGMAFASKEIIAVFNKIKYPYNVNILTQKLALEQLDKVTEMESQVAELLTQREWLSIELTKIACVIEVLKSDANFLMTRIENPLAVFDYLTDKKIIVRDRSKVDLCEGCLRFSIGTAEENQSLVKALRDYSI